MKKILFLLVILFTFFLISGCEAIFTKSPIGRFAPPASDLTPSQLASYANSASADEAEEVLAAIEEALDGMSNDDPLYGELNQAAGTMALTATGLTLSGIMSALEDPTALLTDVNDNIDLLIDAGGYFESAHDAGEELSSSDMILGGVGLILAESGDLASIDPLEFGPDPDDDYAEAYALIQEGAADDPTILDSIFGVLGVTGLSL